MPQSTYFRNDSNSMPELHIQDIFNNAPEFQYHHKKATLRLPRIWSSKINSAGWSAIPRHT